MFFYKKVMILCVIPTLFFCSCEKKDTVREMEDSNTIEMTSQKEDSDNARKAYQELLSQGTISWHTNYEADTDRIEFFCGDIDEDEIPELILYKSDAASIEGYYSVYDYIDGELIELKGINNFTEAYFGETPLFFWDECNTGIGVLEYITVSPDGTTVMAANCETVENVESSIKNVLESSAYAVDDLATLPNSNWLGYHFQVENQDVSSEQFNQYTNSLIKGRTPASIEFVENSRRNRNKYIS